MDLDDALDACPLIAILRGIGPEEIDSVSDALVEAGFRIIEVPLNSSSPLASIERLAKRHGETALVGAGTVMSTDDVIDVRDAGGQLIVMPHTDTDIIEEAKAEGMTCIPGSATPSEAFSALAAGADAIKMFPGEAMPPSIVKAWRAVFPKATRLLVVGGVSADNIGDYLAAGAAGFGIGSALYKPGATAEDVGTRARDLIDAYTRAKSAMS
jgi:2-dehydro-3-deoxyphosphogalactonate aldolase